MEEFVNKLFAIRLSWPLRYLLASLLVGAVTGLHLLFGDARQDSTIFLLYFPIIILCGLVLDYGTSLYVLLLGGFLAVYLFVEPRYTFALQTSDSTSAFVLFLLTGLVICSIIEMTRLGAGRLKRSHDETQKALAERDLLLRELGHRMKNDFQIASSLLRMQSIQALGQEAREALELAADRIAVMARVHARLNPQDDVAVLNLHEFLEDLVSDFQAARLGSRLIALELDLTDVTVPQKDAVYIGLMVNELLTNAIKYAFPDDRPGRVAIVLARDAGHLLLQVTDNGIGTTPPGTGTSSGSGLGLVRSLTEMLGGSLEIGTVDGLTYRARIPLRFEPSGDAGRENSRPILRS